MFGYSLLLIVSLLSVNCQPKDNSTIVVTNDSVATNATKMIVMEFVSGMGRALQQLLSANSVNKDQANIDSNSTLKQENYKIEGQKLREDIIKRVDNLQTIIGTAIEVSKDRRDLISKRILEQANTRLQGAKDRADKILREPHNSEIAVRTLRSINTGINHLSTFVNTLLGRVNISIKVDVKEKPQNENQKKV